MLSVGVRDDGRKQLGLGIGGEGRGRMEENELEEGEACFGQEDDACTNPDIALSYIDEKLQYVLGHFQKHFEAGVSAEKLGAQFGDYGSFLPTYQRSPVRSKPGSPPRAPTLNIPRPPWNSSVKGALQNPTVPTSASLLKNSNAAVSQSKLGASKPRSPPRAPTLNISRSPCNSSVKGALQNPTVLSSPSLSKNSNAAVSQSKLGASKPRSPPRAPTLNISRSPCDSSVKGACQNPTVPTSASLSKNSNAAVSQSKLGVCKPRSPPRAPTLNISRSPCNSSAKGALQNPTVPTSASLSKNSNAAVSQSKLGDVSVSKLNAEEPVTQHDHIDKPVNGSGHKSLKVRIKVGPESVLARNNAAIYSGLGLDISSSSSLENNSYGKGELSPRLRGAPEESPTTILEIMTSFPVPGGYLLSPLPDRFFQMTKKEGTFKKNCKIGMVPKDIPETCAAVDHSTMPKRDVESFVQKKMKSDEKNEISTEAKNSISKDDITTISNKEIDNETPGGQKLLSDSSSISVVSSLRGADGRTDRRMIGDSTKVAVRMVDPLKKSNTISGRDGLSSRELAQDNQLKSTVRTKDHCAGNSGNETTHSRGKPNSKSVLDDKSQEERNNSNHKEISFDKRREHAGKVRNNCDRIIAKPDSTEHKGRNIDTTVRSESVKRTFARKATSSYLQDGENKLLGKYRLPKGKSKLKESQTNDIPAAEITKESTASESSVRPKEKRLSHARADYSKNNSKALNSCKEKRTDPSNGSHRNAPAAVNAENVGSGMDFPKMPNKNKSKNVKLGHAMGPFTFIEKSNARPGGKRVDNSLVTEAAQGNAPLTSDSLNNEAVAASDVPVMIEENWVECVKCKIWRLLLYEAKASDVPDEWQCSMQTWLPGLNKCYIPEEVTANALRALYQVPAPENDSNLNGHHEIAASTITSGDALQVDQSLEYDMRAQPTIGKKSHRLKDESNVQNATKIRRLNDVHDYSSQTKLPNKINLGCPSKPSEHIAEKPDNKQKVKHGIQDQYSDGGVFIQRKDEHSKSKNPSKVDEDEGKHSKSKKRREDGEDGFISSKKMKKEGSRTKNTSKVDEDEGKHSESKKRRAAGEDGFISSKKMKKEGSNYSVKDSRPNLDLVGKTAQALITENGLSTNASGKSLPNYGDYTSPKVLGCDQKGVFAANNEMPKSQAYDFTDGKHQEHLNAEDIETSCDQNENSFSHFLSENVGRSEMGSWRGKSRPFPPKDKHEAQSWASQAVPARLKENKAEVHSTDGVAGDVPRKNLIKLDCHSSIRQATSSCLDASPIRKDDHRTITVLLKEARDQKHTSNRLKKEGLDLESNRLRFDAALKFLYAASLLEAPTFEGAKHGEAMQMYSETAELCEYCAHEYERFNKMAFAALAYKCVEVAYMKGAYCKHLSASKDRNELQAALKIARPGESPSSSASDVDNLNNQATSDKATSTKCTASPHLVGNHVITASNRPIFMRLLNYSSVLNCAFEATRKAQMAVAAAKVNNHGNDEGDVLQLVDRVLDCNYNNVGGVVQKVRLAMWSKRQKGSRP